MTRAPSCLPISTAVSPTPPAAPSTSNVSPGLQMAAMGQREMRGAVGDRKRGGGDEIHRVRDRHDRVGVDRDFLGIAAAEAQHRQHPLPDRKGHRRADLDDLAGGFEAGGERKLGFDLVLAGDHQACRRN